MAHSAGFNDLFRHQQLQSSFSKHRLSIASLLQIQRVPLGSTNFFSAPLPPPSTSIVWSQLTAVKWVQSPAVEHSQSLRKGQTRALFPSPNSKHGAFRGFTTCSTLSGLEQRPTLGMSARSSLPFLQATRGSASQRRPFFDTGDPVPSCHSNENERE